MDAIREYAGARILPVARRRSTAVSQVLKSSTEQGTRSSDCWEVHSTEGRSAFQIRVASDEATRRKAYALAYRVYRRCDLVPDHADGLCVSPFDSLAETITLLAEDALGREVGTVSLVFNARLGLPCDEVYGEEIQTLRRAGCRLVEVTRLALEDEVQNARALLQYLFNLGYLFAKHVRGCTDMLIEVNPRHAEYYKRFLRFEQIGPERPCPRVNGAPAVLLRMNIGRIEAAVLNGHTLGRDAQGRRLQPYSFTREQEIRAVEFLSRQHRPMTFRELHAFKLSGAELASAADQRS